MKRLAAGTPGIAVLAMTAVLAMACGRPRDRTPERVPARWRVVRLTPGHLVHAGKIACTECHLRDFTPPPRDVCARCHEETSWLHHADATLQTPTCTGCHDFGSTPPRATWACLRCHAWDQGPVRAIGAHADQPCADCHQVHHWPPTSRRACLECHPDRQTQHAGLRGCSDCHQVHEASRVTLASIDPRYPAGRGALCERCHAAQPGKLHVDAHALTTGHPDCTSCHVPHSPRGVAPRACRDCHASLPVLAASKHTCAGCHDPHGGGIKPCATCHQEPVQHPAPTKSPLGSCVGCHPPHDRLLAAIAAAPQAPRGALGLGCPTCHRQPTHATARCLDCHTAHGGKPALEAGLCARCHAGQARSTSGTGHAQCTTCHASAIHGPQARPPGCATCHARETAKPPAGHANCAQCHQPHAPRPIASCASCHAAEAATAPAGHARCAQCHEPHGLRPVASCATCHAPQAAHGHGPRVACASCHRPHGPTGVARPPACSTCHAKPTLRGLHQSPTHGDCARCHRAHEARPSDDRVACTICHQDRKNHEPTATRCATCHPFR
ncbi:MAG TPA: hypothetical protein VFT22_07870 [Kofleriaceae bacterium]|nr:hypothetical protein [Kofleriaceae bacterium]